VHGEQVTAGSFKGQVVLVTGSTTGIGAGSAAPNPDQNFL
jgi:NADP-dependent 3-hydroxy acid dehydrogenase YdfG